jgi:formate/nitrite transporter FocA (FNT family)
MHIMHSEENYFTITYGYILITRKRLFTKATIVLVILPSWSDQLYIVSKRWLVNEIGLGFAAFIYLNQINKEGTQSYSYVWFDF